MKNILMKFANWFALAVLMLLLLYLLVIPVGWSLFAHDRIIIHKDGHKQLVKYVVPWPDRHFYVYVVDGGRRLNSDEWYEEHPGYIESEEEILYEGYTYVDEVFIDF